MKAITQNTITVKFAFLFQFFSNQDYGHFYSISKLTPCLYFFKQLTRTNSQTRHDYFFSDSSPTFSSYVYTYTNLKIFCLPPIIAYPKELSPFCLEAFSIHSFLLSNIIESLYNLIHRELLSNAVCSDVYMFCLLFSSLLATILAIAWTVLRVVFLFEVFIKDKLFRFFRIHSNFIRLHYFIYLNIFLEFYSISSLFLLLDFAKLPWWGSSSHLPSYYCFPPIIYRFCFYSSDLFNELC